MGAERLAGTPWHEERVHREDGDERRDKRYCEYYNMKTNKCRKYSESCRGSAHCEYYSRTSEAEHKKRLAAKNPARSTGNDDDIYWY